MNRVKLGDILQIKHGYAFKSENYVDKSPYALVTLANISSSNNFQFTPEKTTYYGADFPDEFKLYEDDLIMPLTEQVVGLFGNSAFVPPIRGIQFVLNQRVGKVIPKDGKADKYYLHYLLSTDTVRDQLEYRASGTRQRNISPDDVYDVTVVIPDIEIQRKIGKILYGLERKINLNSKINDNLQHQLKLIYDYWFTQFDFPDKNSKPYRSSGGAMVWNEQLKRDIPADWQITSITDNDLFQIIKPGINNFKGDKTYLATADIVGTTILNGNIINYETRESRANMQPLLYSVWFAKMKNSIKHLNVGCKMKSIIDNYILSTGFCGLQCSKFSFEYVASFIEYSYFEVIKDTLAHGATQEAVNNDDLCNIFLLKPSDDVLRLYHKQTSSIFSQISTNICENQKLSALRDWLLPMLMNGQLSIMDEQEEQPQINDLGFEQWLTNQGIAARGDVDMEVMRNIYEAMDDDDK